MKPSILLLPDHAEDSWSACNRCRQIKKTLTDFDIDIRGAFDFPFPNDLQEMQEIIKKYDLIHINFTGRLEEYYDLYQRAPKKLIITLINERSFLEGFECKVEKSMEMLMGCNTATSLSKKQADLFKIEYIPNGVDLELFNNPRKPKVFYSGTKRPNKNVELLEEVCKDLGLELYSCTYENNRVPHEKMPEQYRKCDIFVHPSLTEGSSNPVLEALAMQLDVYMTRQGNWHEFEGYVTYFEPTYCDLYEKLKKYTSRKLIESKFTWSAICNKYRLLYLRALGKQKA
jgi:glycosyltransferase involved in cell wall biosynthesis